MYLHGVPSRVRRRVVAILCLACVLAVAGLTSCRDTSAPSSFIIGAVLPLTGDAKTYGVWMTNGMRLAEDHVNKSGKLPKPVKVEIVDSESTAEGGERAFKRLLARGTVDALVTTVTPVTKALIPLVENEKLVLFTSATAPGLIDGTSWGFRNASNIGDEVDALFDVVSKRGIGTIGLIYNNNAVGQWLHGNLGRIAQRHGLRLLSSASYEKGETDFHAQIGRVRTSNPDAIYLYGYNELGLLAKQIRELGVNSQLLGGLDMELPEFVAVGQNAAEGAIFTKSEFDPSSRQTQAFVAAYRAKFGSDPEVYAAIHYDIVTILAHAFKEAGHDREKIRQSVLSLKDFPGVSGLTTFLTSREARKPIAVKTIMKGRPVLYAG